MENILDIRPDPARSLSRDAFQEIMLALRGALPAPLTDDPGDKARRDRAAMAAVAALHPANAAEGRLAALFVVAEAWTMDRLKLASEKQLEIEIARRCTAQGMGMMREAKSSLRLLLRLQAVRERVEANEALAQRAEWIEHSVLGMMAEALAADTAGTDEAAAVSEAPGWDGLRSVSAFDPESHVVRLETEPMGRRQGFRAELEGTASHGVGGYGGWWKGRGGGPGSPLKERG